MNNRRKFIKQLSGLAAMVGLPTAGIAASDFIAQGDCRPMKPLGQHWPGAVELWMPSNKESVSVKTTPPKEVWVLVADQIETVTLPWMPASWTR